MKAIIVAAGPSHRLKSFTNNRPKCLLRVGGKTILERMLETMKQCGIDDIVVIKGYKAHVINYPKVRYYYNPNYESTDILASLFCAKDEINDDFVFSYADILYGEDILRKLLQSKGDICLVVDIDWRRRYEGRHQHPETEAEKVTIEGNRITQITKDVNRISADGAYGEFIGLAKFSKIGARILKTEYERVVSQFQGTRFHDAISIEKAYLTDMIQELIDRGHVVRSVDIEGDWWEIDTPQDLYRARKDLAKSIPQG